MNETWRTDRCHTPNEFLSLTHCPICNAEITEPLEYYLSNVRNDYDVHAYPCYHRVGLSRTFPRNEAKP